MTLAENVELPSQAYIDWLETVAKTTQASGQPLVAQRFREVAERFAAAERLNVMRWDQIENIVKGPQ